MFFDFWFRPPNAQNLLPKICTKSPITQLVWQIDRRYLGVPGGFRGWQIQWNHAKCCGANPCCHGNEIWATHWDLGRLPACTWFFHVFCCVWFSVPVQPRQSSFVVALLTLVEMRNAMYSANISLCMSLKWPVMCWVNSTTTAVLLSCLEFISSLLIWVTVDKLDHFNINWKK